MRLFGEKVGMAFQIKDDLFDFGTDDVGKPRGIDIREKKITLPLIYSLNKADKAKRKRMISIVKNHAEESGRVQDRKSVVEGKSVSVSVDLGGSRIIKKKIKSKRV